MLNVFCFACKCLMPSGTAGLARSARKQTYREEDCKAAVSIDLTERRKREREEERKSEREQFRR